MRWAWAGGLASLLVLGGCGGGKPAAPRDPLVWARSPQMFRANGMPSDRVVLGTVRNRSHQRVRLVAARIRVRDAGGQPVQAWGRYVAAYAHGLYGAWQKPSQLPPGELSRLGEVIELKAGAVVPLAVAFRLRSATRPPLRVDYGPGTLRLPMRARPETRG
jgi:hypothetical protein